MGPLFPSLSLVRCCLLASMAVFQAVGALTRVDVPLIFDSSGRYAVGVTMDPVVSSGNMNFTISTSTGLTYICGTGANTATHNTSSATAQTFSNATKALFFGESTNATIIKEACAFSFANTTSWQYNNQTVVILSDVNNNLSFPAPLGKDMPSVLGLGTNRAMPLSSPSQTRTYQATFQDSLPGQYLLNHPEMTNFTFAMALEKPVIRAQPSSAPSLQPSSNESLPAGMLHLLQTDQALYDVNNVSWVTANISVALNTTSAGGNSSVPDGDWSVIFDGWVFDNDENELRSKGQILANVDPLYTDIYIPQGQAMLIHDAIPGAVQSNLSTLGRLSQAWTLPCNSSFTFSIIIGSQNFTLDNSVLVIAGQNLGNSTCVSGIEAWTDPSETTYLFGSRFISTVYMIFNVARNGTQTIGFAPRSVSTSSLPSSTYSSSHVRVGPIVGGVLGGVFLVIFTGFTVWYILRHPSIPLLLPKRNSDRDRDSSISDSKLPGVIEPFTMLSPSSVEAYNERSPRRQRRSSSPISIVFSHPQEVAEADDRRHSKPPPSYRYHQCYDIEAPDRIYQTTGNISLASASVGSMAHTPVSVSAPTLATMATCG